MSEQRTERAQEIVRKEQVNAARELIRGIINLQENLTVDSEKNQKFGEAERNAIRYANDSLEFFIQSKPKFNTIGPRSIREFDRKKILPGQHAGVFIQLFLNDGSILRVNFWGGLRTTVGNDLRDNDTTNRNSHTQRTDEVTSQLVHLNWQIIFPGNQSIDSWMVFNPDNNGSFRQDDLQIENNKVDIHPLIKAKDSRFKLLKENIFSPIEKLVKLVPTSV